MAAIQSLGLAIALSVALVTRETFPAPLALGWAALAGVTGVLGLAAFYRALALDLMSLVAPLGAVTAAALPAVVGSLGGERLEPAQLAGITVALLAVLFLSWPRGAVRLTPDGLRLALLAGLGFAGFYLASDRAQAAGAEAAWTLVAVRVAGLAAVAPLLARARPRGVVRGLPRMVLLAGLGDAAGNLFFLTANLEGALSIAAVLSSLYPLTTVALAWLVLGERLDAVKVLGAVLAVLGVVLIAL